MCRILGDPAKANKFEVLAAKMLKQVPDAGQSKQAASLMALAGMMEPKQANDQIIGVGGPKNFSCYFGYYMLEAQALAGEYKMAMDNIRQYWGGMLDLGATTFWEEFDLDEASNAAPIYDFVPEGKLDYHRETGKECYVGLRRSLCHGWATGPTAWLSEHVLGIQVLEPGCKKLKIEPHLGDLDWVEGTFPTPMGIVSVKHTRDSNGKISSEIHTPKDIEIVR